MQQISSWQLSCQAWLNFYDQNLSGQFSNNIYSKTLKTHNFLILGSRMHIVFTYCFISLELCFLSFFIQYLMLSNLVLQWFPRIHKGGKLCISPNVVQANSIFILLLLGLQSGWTDFAEIYCTVWPLSMIYVVISFNNIVFVIRFLQGFKLCAQKTEVVEIDEISKFKFDLNRCLGTYQKTLQFENSLFI